MELCRNALDTIRNAIDNEPGMSNEDMKNLVDRVEQGIEGAQVGLVIVQQSLG
jgi:hypothetical protein